MPQGRCVREAGSTQGMRVSASWVIIIHNSPMNILEMVSPQRDADRAQAEVERQSVTMSKDRTTTNRNPFPPDHLPDLAIANVTTMAAPKTTNAPGKSSSFGTPWMICSC